MEATKSFDPYEIIGIITPGTLVALLLASEAPVIRSLMNGQGLTVGDFGLFVLLAFVLGHLIQAFGNVLEWAVWLGPDLPSDFARQEDVRYLSPAQRGTLLAKLGEMEGDSIDPDTVSRPAWRAMTARAYARVNTAGRAGRTDICNRTYGLCRGLTAASTIALLWCLYAHRDQSALLVALALMVVAAVWRMRRAGTHYARSLFLAFIDLG